MENIKLLTNNKKYSIFKHVKVPLQKFQSQPHQGLMIEKPQKSIQNNLESHSYFAANIFVFQTLTIYKLFTID